MGKSAMVGHGLSAVAIDFGTTTSFVARRNGAGPATIVPLSPAAPWMLSVVAYAGGRRVVGDEDNFTPDQLVRSVKRAITERIQNVPVGSGGSLIDADEAMASIFAEIRRRAGAVLTEGEVRLGCPAMWDSGQRKRLIGIARRAGLRVTDATLIDEPVAAGMAWLADREVSSDQPVSGRVLVFDMGGGTLDVAVLNVASPPAKEISVLASRGNPLAGDRLDEAVTADLVLSAEKAGIDFASLRQPAQAKALIARMAREAKIALSTQDVFTIVLSPAVFGRLAEIDYTRAQVEMAFQPLMEHAEKLVEEALAEAQMKERFSEDAPIRSTKHDIDYVLLVGGMSLIPYVRQRLSARFPEAEFVGREHADPVESVVKGLTDSSYERINLHRPAFDFVLEWDGGSQRRLLYEAYTPLYRDWKPSAGRARLNYERRGRTMRLPREGRGHLRVISPSGRPVRLTIDGESIDRLPVRFGFQELVFKLYSDGQVVLTDGLGKQTAMRVDRWPVINSRDASLQLKKVKRKPMEAPPIWFVGAAE